MYLTLSYLLTAGYSSSQRLSMFFSTSTILSLFLSTAWVICEHFEVTKEILRDSAHFLLIFLESLLQSKSFPGIFYRLHLPWSCCLKLQNSSLSFFNLRCPETSLILPSWWSCSLPSCPAYLTVEQECL